MAIEKYYWNFYILIVELLCVLGTNDNNVEREKKFRFKSFRLLFAFAFQARHKWNVKCFDSSNKKDLVIKIESTKILQATDDLQLQCTAQAISSSVISIKMSICTFVLQRVINKSAIMWSRWIKTGRDVVYIWLYLKMMISSAWMNEFES